MKPKPAVVHSPQYHFDIGLHVFPTLKFGAIRRRSSGAG